jgi:hypothetical protein
MFKRELESTADCRVHADQLGTLHESDCSGADRHRMILERDKSSRFGLNLPRASSGTRQSALKTATLSASAIMTYSNP